MTVDELVSALNTLKQKHGDVDVVVWEYNGSDECLKHVQPRYSRELGTVVLEPSEYHCSGATR